MCRWKGAFRVDATASTKGSETGTRLFSWRDTKFCEAQRGEQRKSSGRQADTMQEIKRSKKLYGVM
jgi:hypothetical protein